jgi:hypothetical protein
VLRDRCIGPEVAPCQGMTIARVVAALDTATARRPYELAKRIGEELSPLDQFAVIDAAIAARRRLIAAGAW